MSINYSQAHAIIPICVEHIKFGDIFNQQIEKNILPSGLQSIQYGNGFNQPIDNNM